MNDIEKRIYETYPVTKKERKCPVEKMRMEGLRRELRKRLMGKTKEKVER